MPTVIDFGDERGEVHGTVFLDIPGEPLLSPCYALFLDPANAIIIRSKHTRPGSNEPAAILSTSSLSTSMRKAKPGTRILWLRGGRVVQVDQAQYDGLLSRMEVQSTLVTESNTVVRIGIGQFVKEHKSDAGGDDKGESSSNKDPKVAASDLNLDDVLHVSGDESWGVVTKEDAWVPVSIR